MGHDEVHLVQRQEARETGVQRERGTCVSVRDQYGDHGHSSLLITARQLLHPCRPGQASAAYPTAIHQLLQTAQPQVRRVGRAGRALRIGYAAPLQKANS